MNIRIDKWDDGIGVRIPDEIAKTLGLGEGVALEVSVTGRTLVLRPTGRQDPSYNLEDLLAGVTRQNLHRSADWGADYGREAW